MQTTSLSLVSLRKYMKDACSASALVLSDLLAHTSSMLAAKLGVLGALLDERRLAFKDLERLLQAGYLCLPARLDLLIAIHLGHALLLDLGVVFENSIQLRLDTGAVCGAFG